MFHEGRAGMFNSLHERISGFFSDPHRGELWESCVTRTQRTHAPLSSEVHTQKDAVVRMLCYLYERMQTTQYDTPEYDIFFSGSLAVRPRVRIICQSFRPHNVATG